MAANRHEIYVAVINVKWDFPDGLCCVCVKEDFPSSTKRSWTNQQFNITDEN